MEPVSPPASGYQAKKQSLTPDDANLIVCHTHAWPLPRPNSSSDTLNMNVIGKNARLYMLVYCSIYCSVHG